MPIFIGTQLGSHEITALLGKGGMGEVYRARDLKLKREVAIKVLPDEFSKDRDRVTRFQREAEALAALNHSNIAGIYDVQEANGVRFLVLELVDGDDLAARIRRGPLPLDEALPMAKQICDALESAHERGIVHRDLKPANIKVTREGKVKLLDFGLARLFEGEVNEADPSNSPTVMSRTDRSVILGTASYMSPEQTRGQKAGKQSDIWAFGCVLYEMLTGKRAFAGDTITDILSNVIKADPDWSALPKMTPANIELLLRRCLQKDVRDRLHDMADARIEIEGRAARDTGTVIPAARSSRASLIALIMTLAFLAAVAAASVLYFRRAAQQNEMRVQVITPPTDDLMSLAISPDGLRIVFVATADGKTQLWVRALESVAAEPVSGTDGAAFPFWSPDSRSIGFFADNKLKRVDIMGGPARILANASIARGGTWNPDGVIVFSPGAAGPLFRVSSAGGGQAIPVTKTDPPRSTGHRFPQFLPDGHHFIFNSNGNLEGRGVYLGSLDSTNVQRLLDADSQAIYIPTGYLLFIRQSILLAQRFDTSALRLSGEPIAIAENVSSDLAIVVGAFSYGGGILGYRAGTPSTGRQLLWFDRSGKAAGTVGSLDKNNPFNPNLSPDGLTVALDRQVNGNTDIWLMEIARGVLSRFTVEPLTDRGPVWAPDGTRLAFSSSLSGTQDVYEKPIAGGAETLLVRGPNAKLPHDWSSDGRYILYRDVDQNGGYDLWALPTFGERKPIPVATTTFEERDGQFSPNGQWVVYRSNESGRFEVYVQPFPGPGRKVQISANGGTQPRWRHDGKEIFYISPDSKLMAVPIATSPDGKTIKPQTPVALFPVAIAGGWTPGTNNQQYAVSRDGQRFLVNVATDETSIPITLVLNWNPEIKK